MVDFFPKKLSKHARLLGSSDLDFQRIWKQNLNVYFVNMSSFNSCQDLQH